MRNHYSNLDFLRTIAVLCVALTHILTAFTNSFGNLLGNIGYFGVVIFFVHTSLVLMMSLDREHSNNSSAGLFLPFMIRRIFRIYPLAICAVMTVYVFNLPLAINGSSYPDRSASALASNLLLMQNLTAKVSAPFVMWSLPYEMQMYLLLPALFFLCRRITSVVPLVAICAGAQIFAHFRLLYFAATPDLFSNVPLFMAGVIAFKMLKSDIKPRWAWQLWPVLIGTALIVFLLLKHDSALAAALAIGFAMPLFQQIPSGFVVRSTEQIAKYSFGIYLTHSFCIWLAFTKLARFAMSIKFSVFISLFVLLPMVFYYSVEQPMIRMGTRVSNMVRDRRCMNKPQKQVAGAVQ